MTEVGRFDLTWSDRAGATGLRIGGWTGTEFRALAAMPAAELDRRLAVLPSELAQAAADLAALQPIAGRFEVDQDAVRFLPRFPFVAGTTYSFLVDPALLDIAPGEPRETGETVGLLACVADIQRPAREGIQPARVEAIYPGTGEVPVNLLKLYVQFSAPMSEGAAARAISVRRADTGQRLQGVFLPAGPELWDPERRRLTVFLDPGRIKRGLLPNEREGYPLSEGTDVIVSIDGGFRAANGLPLLEGMERHFSISEAIRRRVDPASWRLRAPSYESFDPLLLEFDRPLDRGLLEHALHVEDEAGMPVPGRVSIGAGERSWRFDPETLWIGDRYAVVIDTRLEDLAGNSVARVFDRDLTRPEDAPVPGDRYTLEFRCA